MMKGQDRGLPRRWGDYRRPTGHGDLKTGEFGRVVIGTHIDAKSSTVQGPTACPVAETEDAPVPAAAPGGVGGGIGSLGATNGPQGG